MGEIIEGHLFTKIFDKLEYAESFLDGNIRFTPLKNYILIEGGRKDLREGTNLNLQLDKTKIIMKIGEKMTPLPNFSGTLSISSTEILEKKCLCLTLNRYSYNSELLNEKKEEEQIDYIFQGITEEEIRKFGNQIVVIYDPETFIKRVIEYFQGKNIFIKEGIVEYKDLSKFHGEILNEGFVKDIKYQSENEYRMLADIAGEGIQEINIGSLRDIAIVMNYEQFKKIELVAKSEG